MKKSYFVIVLLIAGILLSGCVTQGETYCTEDSDCACGTHVTTGECFTGNKVFVDTARHCPDFCTGIAGNLETKCIENKCTTTAGQLVGNDTDEHGCIGSAGYAWCEEKQKCLRFWEEECLAENTGLPNPASVYCEEQGGSLRIEEGETGQVGICTLADGTECEEWAYYMGECPGEKLVEDKAGEFCNNANVAEVFICGDYVKVVSSLLGGGSTYYTLENNEWSPGIQCPVVGPDSMSEECRLLTMGSNCIESEVC